MLTLPIRSIPGHVWPPLPSSDLTQLWALHLELQQTQWLEPAAILDGQLAQLRALLAHCSQHVPYYRDLFKNLGVRPEEVRSLDDFRRIPLLSRSTYQQQFAQFQASQLPEGMVNVGMERTSGTSGMAIEIWKTNTVARWWLACYLRDLLWSGIDMRRSLAVIRYLGKEPPNLDALMQGTVRQHWQPVLAPLLQSGPAHVMDLRQEMSKQLEWLLRIQPDYLFGSPPNLDYLGGLLTASGQRLHNLKVVQVYSETLTPEVRRNLESAFGVSVKSMYSCTEAGYLASPCPEGHGLHVHAEHVLLEVLDDKGQPCRPGESGRVVLTTLHNFLTPFVRYEILDGATLGSERCPCGRGLPLLASIEGRQRPLLRLADGRRKDARPLIVNLPAGVTWQRQIIQRTLDHVVIRLVPRPGKWQDGYIEDYVRAVREYFEAPVRVEVQIFERLEVPPGGKIRDIVCEVGDTP